MRGRLTPQTIAPLAVGPRRLHSVESAVREFIKPGMVLHTLSTHHFSQPLVYEIIRQFWRRSPGFTLITISAREPGVIMAWGGLLRKLIASHVGNTYPRPGPNRCMQEAVAQGRLEVEHCSLLGIVNRLQAAAIGVPFMPTRSLAASSLAESSAFATVESPFQPGARIGVVAALAPDLTLVHGLLADTHGNVVLPPPFGEGLVSAMASEQGVLATVEAVVESDVVRRCAHLPVIPAYRVRALCEVPWGAHPRGLYNPGLGPVEPYAEDYDFLEEFSRASRDGAAFEKFVRDWILELPSFEAYLQKLGAARLAKLRHRAQPDYWVEALDRVSRQVTSSPATPLETAVIAAARTLERRVIEAGHTVILTGIGVANLAAWVANQRLKRAGTEVGLAAEMGMYGYDPRPGEPFVFNLLTVPTCLMTGGIAEVLGLFAAGRHNRCIGIVGAGQVDRSGAINSTYDGDALLAGSGGVNDLLSAAAEAIVIAEQSPQRFVPKVSYCTGPGARVSQVISPRGVYQKRDGELVLVAVPRPPRPELLDEAVREAVSSCGWPLRVAEPVATLDPPNFDELALLRAYDPDGHFTRNPQRGDSGSGDRGDSNDTK